ncbi:hypothetical protein PHYPSEUDO_010359 [Phytophthora pseudosyringae]|uniref:Uncharacterized protein n=1 Tax=Phytophthora pseudosyringae TaxID=221518 RepID=A0A8T1WB30_9STRA|nr:hypothetical protein PHYPSEUDO_010359 [Phytophthora pseudosyringae]
MPFQGHMNPWERSCHGGSFKVHPCKTGEMTQLVTEGGVSVRGDNADVSTSVHGPCTNTLEVIGLVSRGKAFCCSSSSDAVPPLGQSSLLTILDRRAHFSSWPPDQIQAPMRFGCLLLVVAFALAACCHSLVSAESAAPNQKNPETSYMYNVELSTADNVKHYLKGIKKTTAGEWADEERAFPGVAQLKGFFEKIAKGADGQIAVEKVKTLVLDKKTRHPSVSVLLSLLKMLAFVGVVSVTSGYIIYRVSNG